MGMEAGTWGHGGMDMDMKRFVSYHTMKMFFKKSTILSA
jgi:hypothetical protein